MKNPEKLLVFSGFFRYNEPRIDKNRRILEENKCLLN